MKSRIFLALSIGASLMVAGGVAGAQAKEVESTKASAAPSNAQSPVHETTPSDSTRGYDARALRFETSWGNVSIIRGANGAVVGTSGWFRDYDLEKLLAASPRAVAEARDYETQNFRGSLVGGLGALTTVVGVVIAANGSNDASSPILVIAGVSGIVWGAQHLSMSYSALSRAIWWFNRDAAR
ncbi:MAG: hypothetical protein ACREMS_00600 [Gemmatimonadaceae bacterium]